MGPQLIVKADHKQIEKSLDSLTSECEIFAIAEGLSAFQFLSEFSHPRVKMLFYINLNTSSVLTFGRGLGKSQSGVCFSSYLAY